MRVPFLDLKIQYQSIKTEVDAAIHDVIDNTAFILGKHVTQFEKGFAAMHDVKNCIAVGSGTDANHLVLWSQGIEHGDEIIIPVNTFIATAWGATLCGATPVFVDCEPDSYNIDPDKIEAAITSRTKAIVAVHLYGQPADMDRLREIADKHKLLLVEDAAQAHLAEYKGRRAGSIGDAASFSFYPGKNLGAYGEGGAVTTNNDQTAASVKKRRDHGALQKYNHEEFGHNYRMDGIQGAVLNTKLKYIEKWTEERREAASKYRELLSDIRGIKLPKEMSYAKHVYHLFIIEVEGGKENRDELAAFLNDKGIGVGLHYPIPLHMQKCFEYLGYNKGDFPVAESLSERILSLPMFPELTDDQIKYVAENIKEYFRVLAEGDNESNKKQLVEG